MCTSVTLISYWIYKENTNHGHFGPITLTCIIPWKLTLKLTIATTCLTLTKSQVLIVKFCDLPCGDSFFSPNVSVSVLTNVQLHNMINTSTHIETRLHMHKQTPKLYSWVYNVNVNSVWHNSQIRCDVMVKKGERQRESMRESKTQRGLEGLKWGACLTLVLSLQIKRCRQQGNQRKQWPCQNH